MQVAIDSPETARQAQSVGRSGAHALQLALALVWGANWAVTKVGLRDVPPFTFGALRVILAIVTVAILVLPRRGIRLPPREDLSIVVAVGLGQIAASIALMNLALEVVPAGRSSVLVFTMPLWVAVMQAGLLHVPLNRGEVTGLLVGMAGIGLLLNPAAMDWGSSGQLLGAVELLLSAVIWAGTTIYLRRHRWRSSPIDLQLWELLLALVPLGLLALTIDSGRASNWQPSSLAAIAYSGVLATGFAYWASQSITRALTPLATTAGFLAIPVVGLVTAAAALGEAVSPLDVAGFALTLGGVAIVSLASRSPDRALEVATPDA